MENAFLALGSNVGDRESYLRRAVDIIADFKGSRICRVSSLYETDPWGKKDQEVFLNQVIEIKTKMNPHELLSACQNIERTLGRSKEEQWGPRTIDVDLLLYSEIILKEDTIQIPHPRLSERRFVLVPLAELAPAVFIPGSDKTVEEVLLKCSDMGSVKLYSGKG